MLSEWAFWGGQELFQSFLGSIWIAFLLMFILFFYNYRKFYNQGVKQRDKSAYLTFLDLEKVARKIACAFLLFLVGSVALTYAEGFDTTLLKGSVLSALVFPPIYLHFNDQSKYRFDIVKGD